MAHASHQDTIPRLKRVEGQVRGIIRMIEEERYCMDILIQVQAVKAALAKVEAEVLRQHAGHCVEDAIRSGDAAEQRRLFTELAELMGKFRG
ncbi:metal-sensitive transcriptional regulator [Iodidimonas sp. SYSU 1G8]|uniref:metal-sensitive transcriptional regulator n=1 Tax=Iodidimonas sp. SYSU 1G8 TaxID=3133967 RepID=UPI0031FEA407